MCTFSSNAYAPRLTQHRYVLLSVHYIHTYTHPDYTTHMCTNIRPLHTYIIICTQTYITHMCTTIRPWYTYIYIHPYLHHTYVYNYPSIIYIHICTQTYITHMWSTKQVSFPIVLSFFLVCKSATMLTTSNYLMQSFKYACVSTNNYITINIYFTQITCVPIYSHSKEIHYDMAFKY